MCFRNRVFEVVVDYCCKSDKTPQYICQSGAAYRMDDCLAMGIGWQVNLSFRSVHLEAQRFGRMGTVSRTHLSEPSPDLEGVSVYALVHAAPTGLIP